MKQKGRNSSNSASGGQKPARASIGPMAWAGTAHSQSYASTPQAMAKVLEVLATVDANGSKTLFLKYTEPDAPQLVRSAAFRALRGVKLTANQIKAMMASLEDKEQREVHEAIREVLVQVPELPTGLAPALKRMLSRARLTLTSELAFALNVDEEDATKRLDRALPKPPEEEE